MADPSPQLATTTPSYDDKARYRLANFLIAQFTAVIAAILYLAILKVNVPDGQMIITAEITFMSLSIGYYFGSSSGSAVKDKILSKLSGGETK